ncbi:DUF202 domain-containing protein [Clostridium botulinum]|uniref:DUF202 domain-containing protein n=1 Tax=Clostridium botulinum TaxID=1491 RepID=UPI001E32384F|nr:DUF202 domain-containing protein [Clostridium botulinum]
MIPLIKDKEKKVFNFKKDELILRDLLATDRTILANERTFLSYLRTFLSLLIAGCTLIKIPKSMLLHVTGYILIIIGTVIGIHGIKTFIKIDRNLKNIKYISDEYEIK